MKRFVDLNVSILQWHFAIMFTCYNLLIKWRLKPVAIVGKYTWGILFVLHDWLVEHLLMRHKFERSVNKLDLVTDRLERYKEYIKRYGSVEQMPSTIRDRYLWSVEKCDFLSEFDKRKGGHC